MQHPSCQENLPHPWLGRLDFVIVIIARIGRLGILTLKVLLGFGLYTLWFELFPTIELTGPQALKTKERMKEFRENARERHQYG